MDLGAVLSAFGLVLLASLGDKAELTTMLLGARAASPGPVFAGAAVALVVSALLGSVFGTALQRLISTDLIHRGSGIAFVVVGLLLLLGR